MSDRGKILAIVHGELSAQISALVELARGTNVAFRTKFSDGEARGDFILAKPIGATHWSLTYTNNGIATPVQGESLIIQVEFLKHIHEFCELYEAEIARVYVEAGKIAAQVTILNAGKKREHEEDV